MEAKYINESSIFDIKKEDIINRDTYNIWMEDSYIEELMIFNYRREEYIKNNITDEEILNSVDFKNYVKYEIEYRVEKIINQFQIFNNEIIIWRSLLVNENWLEHFFKDGKRVGIYWSYDKDVAEPHGGYNDDDKKINIKIESSIKEEYIDWINTIRLNISPNTEDEKEIRLFKNTPLKIRKIEVGGEEIDINLIISKTFKS